MKKTFNILIRKVLHRAYTILRLRCQVLRTAVSSHDASSACDLLGHSTNCGRSNRSWLSWRFRVKDGPHSVQIEIWQMKRRLMSLIIRSYLQMAFGAFSTHWWMKSLYPPSGSFTNGGLMTYYRGVKCSRRHCVFSILKMEFTARKDVACDWSFAVRNGVRKEISSLSANDAHNEQSQERCWSDGLLVQSSKQGLTSELTWREGFMEGWTDSSSTELWYCTVHLCCCLVKLVICWKCLEKSRHKMRFTHSRSSLWFIF